MYFVMKERGCEGVKKEGGGGGGGGGGECMYLKLSAGDLELKVNSEGVEGMERTEAAPGLGGSWRHRQQ